MHDTPEGRDMFATNERALSHGCIHLEHPAEMAQWLLRDKPDWTLERVEHTMQEGLDNNTVYLTKPVPILIVYGTAIVQDDGEVSLLPGRLRPRRISRSSLGQRLPVSIDCHRVTRGIRRQSSLVLSSPTSPPGQKSAVASHFVARGIWEIIDHWTSPRPLTSH